MSKETGRKGGTTFVLRLWRPREHANGRDVDQPEGHDWTETEWQDESDDLGIMALARVTISDPKTTSSCSCIMEVTEKSNERKTDEEEKEEEEVAASTNETSGDCEEPGISFCPPVYLQRYGRVREELTKRLEKLNLDPGSFKAVVEFGCAEFGMHFHLKHLPNVGKIVYVDIDKYLLESRLNNIRPLPFESLCKRETPLTVDVYAGCATLVDSRLVDSDVPVYAIVGIEILEHLNKDVEEKFIFNLFKKYAPPLVILTTPNGDFNTVFGLEKGEFRHWDHRFELSRQEFIEWCTMVCTNFPMYTFSIQGIAEGPPGTEEFGCVSQMAIFELDTKYVADPEVEDRTYLFRNDAFRVDRPSNNIEPDLEDAVISKTSQSEPYELLISVEYPWSPKAPLEARVINEIRYYTNTYTLSSYNLQRHYDNGGGDTVFVGMDTIVEVLDRNVPDAMVERSLEEIL
ncbi:unnamed protein product [Allacma fusca]|uniref:Small RNA 2'-O-methyltransferase n=1 Tax=Allacma fusca TaxID=39272 RepID=A0A8J2K9N1_9HEXA|nr:unnamed protein product [Allacma fusca]